MFSTTERYNMGSPADKLYYIGEPQSHREEVIANNTKQPFTTRGRTQRNPAHTDAFAALSRPDFSLYALLGIPEYADSGGMTLVSMTSTISCDSTSM